MNSDEHVFSSAEPLPDGQALRADQEPCPPARTPPAVSPAFLDDWQVQESPAGLAGPAEYDIENRSCIYACHHRLIRPRTV